jgi:predicted phosphodiesterase
MNAPVNGLSMPDHTELSRIGVIGDIHASASSLKISLEFLEDLKLQTIFCTGDIVDGPECVDTCCSLLIEHNVQAVVGNRDQWFTANEMRSIPEATLLQDTTAVTRKFIGSLPLVREYKTAQGGLLLCHGIGPHTMKKVRDDDYGYALETNFELQEIISANRYRIMVNGHTHYRMVKRFGQLTVINAGTIRPGHQPCFLTIDFTKRRVQYYNLIGKMADPAAESETVPF